MIRPRLARARFNAWATQRDQPLVKDQIVITPDGETGPIQGQTSDQFGRVHQVNGTWWRATDLTPTTLAKEET